MTFRAKEEMEENSEIAQWMEDLEDHHIDYHHLEVKSKKYLPSWLRDLGQATIDNEEITRENLSAAFSMYEADGSITQKELQQAIMQFDHYCFVSNVMNIVGENEIAKGDKKSTNKGNTFPKFFLSQLMCSTSKHYEGTILATLYAVQLGQLWTLGNPFDKLSDSTSTSKDTEALLLSLGQASSMFLPSIIWTAMFHLNFIYTSILALSLPFQVPIISMLVLSLVCYDIMLAGTVSRHTIFWGSVKMSGPLFAFGVTMGFMLIIGIITVGVLFVIWGFFLNIKKEAQVTS